MSGILVEPSSPRADHKVWVWQYGNSVHVPVKVSMIRKDDNTQYFNIPTVMYVRMLIKDDLRDSMPILEKVYNFSAPNIFIVELSTEEVIALRAGKMYHVGMALYDEQDNFVRTLVADLPLRVEKSALSNSVF